MADLHTASPERTESAGGTPTVVSDDPMHPYRMAPTAEAANPPGESGTVTAAGLPAAAELLSGVDRPVGPNNPAPDTWQHDKSGHLTRAGNEFTALYDLQGNPTMVEMQGEVWTKTKPDEVQHDWYGRGDNQWHRDMIENVTGLTVTPDAKTDAHGEFAGVEVKVDFGSGSSDSNWSKIFESPQHQHYVHELWKNERAAEEAARLKPKN